MPSKVNALYSLKLPGVGSCYLAVVPRLAMGCEGSGTASLCKKDAGWGREGMGRV